MCERERMKERDDKIERDLVLKRENACLCVWVREREREERIFL